MNPCSCLTLTQISQRNHSRMKKGECESSLFAWVCVQLVNFARVMAEGVWRGIYTSPPENQLLGQGYPETPGISPETPDQQHFLHQSRHPETPGNRVRSIRPYTRSIRVWQDTKSGFVLLSGVYGSHKFFQVLLSTSSRSKPLNQVSLDSTAFLYSNFKYKN